MATPLKSSASLFGYLIKIKNVDPWGTLQNHTHQYQLLAIVNN